MTLARKPAHQVGAFEVEIEVFWCGAIDRLAGGKTVEAWLHPDWTVRRWQTKGAELIGVFTKAMPLADFRGACFEALEAMR